MRDLPNELDDLLPGERWPLADSLALPGMCRGSLLGHWADNCRLRAGAGAVFAVRARLPTDVGALLPDDPPATAWYPCGVQLVLADALLDVVFQGSAAVFVAATCEDAERRVPKAMRLGARALGPRRLLDGLGKLYPQGYDVGAVTARTGSGEASLAYEGAPLLAHPTFRLIQAAGVAAAIRLGGRSLTALRLVHPGPQRFTVQVGWT